MAGYREHVSVSGVLGVMYGTAGVVACGFAPVPGALAAALTWVAGMLPDLDSDTGRPIREVFSLCAAVVPMLLVRRLIEWGGNMEGTLFLALLLYASIRYGGAALLARITVHRGMFHSVPAMLIAAELVFLAYKSDSLALRAYMAGGVALGFLSHLVLDEMYSVSWSGVTVKLNKMAGSALKAFGKSMVANAVSYGLLLFLTWQLLNDVGLLDDQVRPSPEFLRQAAEDAPAFQ